MSGTISLSAGSLCVRYHRTEDRLAHEIGIVAGDSFYPVLESIEGTPADSWPTSPPIQQIVEEIIGTNLFTFYIQMTDLKTFPLKLLLMMTVNHFIN